MVVCCAVTLCRNYTRKNIKGPEGVSFHRFPTDTDQKHEWIRAIRREPHWTPGAHCRVCSAHFDNADFRISETGRRILNKDAVPTKNLYREERTNVQGATERRIVAKKVRPEVNSHAHLVACSACLNVDVKLFDLEDTHLENVYEDISGSVVLPADGLPRRVCSICAAILLKCAEFRTRCETVQEILEDASEKNIEVTTEFLKSIDRSQYKLIIPLAIKKQLIIDTTKTDTKQENLDLYPTVHDDDSVIDLNHDTDDTNDLYDTFDEKHSNARVCDTEIKIDPESDIIDDVNDDNNSHTEIITSDLDKSEIVVEVTTKDGVLLLTPKYVLKESKKRKCEQTFRQSEQKLKKATKKLKKNVDEPMLVKQHPKEHNRNTKPRKTDEDYEMFSKMYDVDISFLSKDEQIAEVLARKDSDNYKNSKYKCDECYKGFAGEMAFKNHKAKHDPSIGVYRCEPCGFRFAKRRKMLKHLTHHKMNFVCRLCGHVNKQPLKAKEHFKWHNGVNYPCHFCEKTFIKRSSQFNHMRNWHGKACCDICQEVFSGERGLNAHMVMSHKQAVKTRCEACGVQFLTEDALNRHLDSLPEGLCDNSLKACQHCGDNFPSEELLNEHCKQNHWKEIKCEKWSDCRLTSATLVKGKPDQLDHGYTSMGSIPTQGKHSCDEQCNANFENEKLYRMHRIIHKECRPRRPRVLPGRPRVKPGSPGGPGGQGVQGGGGSKPRKIQQRMCEVCGLTCQSEAALRYHQRIHTGEKPYQCSVCHKSFRLQDSLQCHMNSHTGDRPFQCSLCDKGFTTLPNLHRHRQQVHENRRPYVCTICNKAFNQNVGVKIHINTVHLKMPAPPRKKRIRNSKKVKCEVREGSEDSGEVCEEIGEGCEEIEEGCEEIGEGCEEIGEGCEEIGEGCEEIEEGCEEVEDAYFVIENYEEL